jgi:hypothetical protein
MSGGVARVYKRACDRVGNGLLFWSSQLHKPCHFFNSYLSSFVIWGVNYRENTFIFLCLHPTTSFLILALMLCIVHIPWHVKLFMFVEFSYSY